MTPQLSPPIAFMTFADDDAGEHEHRADREVDAGGDDHVGQARPRGRAAPRRRWRCCARWRRRRTRSNAAARRRRSAPSEDQADRRARAGDAAAASSGGAALARAPRRRAPRRRVGRACSCARPPRGRSARRSWRRRRPPSRRPAACSRATRAPSRSTSMRSATSKTSGMLWLISTTDRPCSRTRLIRSSTLRVCTTPSAAVGSSMKTTLLAHVTARQIAMPWRWPPDMFATGARRCPGSLTPRSLNASSLRRRISRLVEEAELAEQARRA